MLEPARTNAILYSSDFSQWGVKSNVTINSNVGLAPDGTLSADRIVFNGTTNARVEDGAQGINATSYTNDRPNSVWLKSESGTTTVQFGSSSAYLLTVTVTEEWQRFTYIGKQGFPRIKSDNATSVLAWGYQFETNGDVSLSYATSYIPTSGSIGTRSAEVCTNSGNDQVINSTEGVLYAEISALNSTASSSQYISISDGTYNNRASILFSSGSVNAIRTFLRVGGAVQIDVNNSVADVTDFNKIAFSYKENDFKVYINGSLASSDTSGSVWSTNTITKLSFSEINTSTNKFEGNVKDVKIYNTALTDQELIALTS